MYVILLIAIACGICGADYANHEIRLLRTTRRGRKQHMGIKCILGFLGTVTAFALVYIVRLCNVLSAYGTQGLNAPAASMEHLWRVSQNISVGQYILIIMLMRFIGGLLVSLFVFAMFKYLRSGMSVIISCVLFIVLPLALVAFGVGRMRSIFCLIRCFLEIYSKIYFEFTRKNITDCSNEIDKKHLSVKTG